MFIRFSLSAHSRVFPHSGVAIIHRLTLPGGLTKPRTLYIRVTTRAFTFWVHKTEPSDVRHHDDELLLRQEQRRRHKQPRVLFGRDRNAFLRRSQSRYVAATTASIVVATTSATATVGRDNSAGLRSSSRFQDYEILDQPSTTGRHDVLKHVVLRFEQVGRRFAPSQEERATTIDIAGNGCIRGGGDR